MRNQLAFWIILLVSSGATVASFSSAGAPVAALIEEEPSSDKLPQGALAFADQSDQGFAKSVRTPKTPLEILQNSKVAWERGMLTNERFCQAELLKRIFGGIKVEQGTMGQEGAPIELNCEVSDFGVMAPSIKLGDNVIEAMSIQITREFQPNQKISGELRITIRNEFSDLGFEQITALFGSDWSYSKDLISPHRVMARPTRPNGNARIEYHQSAGTVKFEFGPSATLSSASFFTKKGN